MEICINGVAEPLTVRTLAELVARRGLATDSLVIEVNQRIIRQADWASTLLNAGDRIELLNFVGGG